MKPTFVLVTVAVVVVTFCCVEGNDVSDRVLQWLKSESGQPLHMFPSGTLDRQAVSLGRLFKRADMIRLLKRAMEQPDSLGDSDEQEEMLEDDDEDQISKRAAMVRLLRSPNHQLRLLRSEAPQRNQEKKAKMVRLL